MPAPNTNASPQNAPTTDFLAGVTGVLTPPQGDDPEIAILTAVSNANKNADQSDLRPELEAYLESTINAGAAYHESIRNDFDKIAEVPATLTREELERLIGARDSGR